MRPMGEVAKALLKTACELSAAGRRVTLAEMAAGACVGKKAARYTVASLKKRGHLQIVGQRRVSYRPRPVAEYVPAALVADGVERADLLDLGRWLSAWPR